jgi:hypothetical protein
MNYYKIGVEAGLAKERLAMYINYMRLRGGQNEAWECDTGIAADWAGRFRQGLEWACSDGQGQVLLIALYIKYAQMRGNIANIVDGGVEIYNNEALGI